MWIFKEGISTDDTSYDTSYEVKTVKLISHIDMAGVFNGKCLSSKHVEAPTL